MIYVLIYDTFFSVCETIYHQKNVSESKPECKTVTEPMCMMSSSGIETCLDMTKKVSPVNTQNYRHEQGTNSSRIGRINWKQKWYSFSKLNLTYCEKEMFRLSRFFFEN